jgi:hypothetical protein
MTILTRLFVFWNFQQCKTTPIRMRRYVFCRLQLGWHGFTVPDFRSGEAGPTKRVYGAVDRSMIASSPLRPTELVSASRKDVGGDGGGASSAARPCGGGGLAGGGGVARPALPDPAPDRPRHALLVGAAPLLRGPAPPAPPGRRPGATVTWGGLRAAPLRSPGWRLASAAPASHGTDLPALACWAREMMVTLVVWGQVSVGIIRLFVIMNRG